MNVAVTGATGFVGGHVVDHLVEQGHTVIAYGRRPVSDFAPRRNTTYVQWDITRGPIDPPSGVDAVVHCAAGVTDWGTYRDLHLVNVGGTEAVLDTFHAVPQFIHISTSSVYDMTKPTLRINEDAILPQSHEDAYSQTKMLSERAVEQRRANAVVLRPHAIYGPSDRTVLVRLRRARRFGRQLAIGNGRNRISLTHVANLSHAVECALSAPNGYHVFNVADATESTLDETLRQLASAFGFNPRVVYIPTGLAMGLATVLERAYQLLRRPKPPFITRYIASRVGVEFTLDIAKAQREIGYTPRQTYATAFAEMAALVAPKA